MDAEESDAALAARIAAGDDREAESALCRRFFPRIRAYGRLHLDANASADLAQEVLVVLIRALREGRVSDVDRLPAYVSGVARNVARDWKRGETRRKSLLERFPTDASYDEAPAPMDRSRLVHCLGQLSARDRAIVVLTYYAEKDGGEIAGELSMSLANVRVARHRALKQLLLCIGRET